LTDHVPATVHDLLQMINVLKFLMINQLLQSPPNRVVHRIKIRLVGRLNKVRNICL